MLHFSQLPSRDRAGLRRARCTRERGFEHCTFCKLRESSNNVTDLDDRVTGRHCSSDAMCQEATEAETVGS